MPLARQAADAAQVVAQGDDGGFFTTLRIHLPQPHTRQQAVAQAAFAFGIHRQAAFVDKVIQGGRRAALKQAAVPVGVGFAQTALLQEAQVAHPAAGGVNGFIRKRTAQLRHFEGETGG